MITDGRNFVEKLSQAFWLRPGHRVAARYAMTFRYISTKASVEKEI